MIMEEYQYKQTRGHRNNNPLNVILTKDKWKGMSKVQSDGRFIQFESRIYGFRCALICLRRYFSRGWNTIDSIVRHWCPDGTEDSYIKLLCRVLGVNKDYRIDYLDESFICYLVNAMAYQETGNWYPVHEILDAYRMVNT